jgi:membrane fusion protein, multidrug efflux system
MKAKKIIIGAGVLLVVAAGVVALLKTRAPAGAGDEQSSDDNVPTIISVQVGALTNVTLHRYLSGYGTIEPAPATANQPAAGGPLAAPSAGIVAKINVVIGQHVKKGDVLMTLNSATATFDYAKAELGRQRKLFAQQNTSLKNVEDAAAQLASLEIIAPVSGTVTSLSVRPGQAVDTTTAVAEVIDLDRLALSIKIPSEKAGQLRVGEETQIASDPPVTAPLSLVSFAVDAVDGTVAAWALLPPRSGLRPGQFVQFELVTETRINCLAAPSESVVTDENGQSSIWIVNGDQATQTSVKTGLRNEDWVELKGSRLKAGQPVVTVGAYGLPEKTQIKILNQSNQTNSRAAQ